MFTSRSYPVSERHVQQQRLSSNNQIVLNAQHYGQGLMEKVHNEKGLYQRNTFIGNHVPETQNTVYKLESSQTMPNTSDSKNYHVSQELSSNQNNLNDQHYDQSFLENVQNEKILHQSNTFVENQSIGTQNILTNNIKNEDMNMWNCGNTNFGSVSTIKTSPENVSKISQSVSEVPNAVICDMCFKHFTTKTIKRHVRVVHTNKKLYQCEICNATLGDKFILRTHISTVHEDKKLFLCTICGRGFNRKVKLEQHMSSVHEGTKFPCLICHKTYVFKSDLKRHISDRHSGSLVPGEVWILLEIATKLCIKKS